MVTITKKGTSTKTINAKHWEGHASHWQLKHMDAGEQRLGDVCLRMGWSLSKATTSLYGIYRLSLQIRANARAILSRTASILVHEQLDYLHIYAVIWYIISGVCMIVIIAIFYTDIG